MTPTNSFLRGYTHDLDKNRRGDLLICLSSSYGYECKQMGCNDALNMAGHTRNIWIDREWRYIYLLLSRLPKLPSPFE